MRRRPVLIAVAVVAFLAISLALARYLTTENVERDEVYAVLEAQARGDVAAMRARLTRCDAACVADARRLKRPGTVKILRLDSPTAYALGAASGTTRVAWTIVDRQLPVVQCVRVRRTGNALFGRRVLLDAISRPIGNQDTC